VTQDEFREQMQRISKTYGAERYPQERIVLLWEEFKNLDGWLFSAAVSRLIADNAVAPMATKFREAIAEARERATLWDKKRQTLTRPTIDENAITYAEYVRRCIDGDRRADIADLVKVWGMERVDDLYQRGKREHETGVPDNTDVAAMFSGSTTWIENTT
jgi:hypothetical protein